MCMLSFYPAGAAVNAEHLLAGSRKNRDGYGYAIVTGTGPGHMIVGKSMKAWELVPEFVAALNEARETYPNAVALFHSRWGTGGTVNEYNCHPFYMGDGDGGIDELTVVAHNGVFFSPNRHSKDERRCDTRIFAEEILPEIPMFDAPDVLPFWEDEIGRGNKVVVLTANPAYRHRAYMLNPQAGQWVANGAISKVVDDDACWHSNADWRNTYREAYREYPNGSGKWDWKEKKWVPGVWAEGIFVPADGSTADPPGTHTGTAATAPAAPAPRRKSGSKGPRKPRGRAASKVAAPDTERGVQILGDDGWNRYTSHTGRKYSWKRDATPPLVNADGTPAECSVCYANGELLDADAMLCLNCSSCLGCGCWAEECKCTGIATPNAPAEEVTLPTTVTSGAVELYTGGGTRYGQDPDSSCVGSNWDPVTGLCDAADCRTCATLYAQRQGTAYVIGSHASLE